jgi:putative phage abortive infection protein
MSQDSKSHTAIKWGIWICIVGASILIVLGVVAAFAGYRTPRHDDNFLNDVGNWGSYTSLVRAQLSAYELSFLFYNGICPIAKKFKPLIEEFGLLEHLDKKLLLDSSHESFYEKSAFK